MVAQSSYGGSPENQEEIHIILIYVIYAKSVSIYLSIYLSIYQDIYVCIYLFIITYWLIKYMVEVEKSLGLSFAS